MTDTDTSLACLREKVMELCRKKDWGVHGVQNPQHVAMAMTVEMSELLEHFQWLNDEGVRRLVEGRDEGRRAAIAEEFADVMMYGLQLSHTLRIDVAREVERKIAIVEKRPNSRAELASAGEAHD